MNKPLIIILHTLLILLAWLSPFYLDWKLILAFVGLYFIQILIFRGCMLTNIQFNKSIRKETDMTMYSYYLELLGFKPNKEKVRFTARYIMPLIIIIISLVWQILLNNNVLFHF